MRIKLVVILILFFNITTIFSQRVGTKPAKIKLENYNAVSGDGILTFQIDTRMADVISKLELNDLTKSKKEKSFWDRLYEWWWFKVRKKFNFEISKTYTRILNNDNYYQGDLIYMKCELVSLKSMFGRKIKKKIEINLYSYSGKIIFTKTFELNKNKLISESYR